MRLRELSENSRTIRERDKEVSFRGVSASFPGISRFPGISISCPNGAEACGSRYPLGRRH